MNVVPISLQWLERQEAGMSATQLGQCVRLLAWLTRHAEPLPLSIEHVRAIARANTRDEERELDRLLTVHFSVTDAGRVPADLGTLSVTGNASHRNVMVTSGVTSRPASREEVNRLRQKRYRERLEPLRAECIARGLKPGKNASFAELNAMLGVTPDVTLDVTQPSRERHSRVPARGIQNLNTNTEQPPSLALGLTPSVTPGGLAALAMRRAGMADCNPSHPDLIALIDAGVSAEELGDIARECVAKGKGFAYALAVAKGRRREAARAEAIPPASDKLAALVGPAVAARIGRGQ